MSKFVRLVNTTERRLPISFNDSEIVWEPAGQIGSVLELPKDAADYCLGHFGNLLMVVEPKNQDFTQQEVYKEYWLANMTGDPDAWDKRPAKQYNYALQKWEVVDIINENRDPAPFISTLGRYNGFVDHWVTYIDGEPQRNVKPTVVTIPGRRIEIPPYSRAKVTADQLTVLMQRDADAPLSTRGRIIVSRPPSEFEPDFEGENSEYWTIDKMRCWLTYMPLLGNFKAGKEVMGRSEADIRKELETNKATATKTTMEIYKTRKELWIRCFLRAANPQFILPNQKTFEAGFDKFQKNGTR